jgi:hypothetical protein
MSLSATDTDQAQATFGRYAETAYDRMTSEQQEGFRILAKAEGGELHGPAKIWVDNTNLAKAVAPLADHFHPPNHSLTQREREIAVCVILGKWQAAFPINAHNRVAIELAIPPEVVDAWCAVRVSNPAPLISAGGWVASRCVRLCALFRWAGMLRLTYYFLSQPVDSGRLRVICAA